MAWTRPLGRPASMSQNDCKTSRSRPPRSLRPFKPTRYAARSTVSLAYHTFLQHLARCALWAPAHNAGAPIAAGMRKRPTRQSADALPRAEPSRPVQTRTLPSLVPSFRGKGRQEFTHRHSHSKNQKKIEIIACKKEALKVETVCSM